jgi:hypothetical protein
MFSEPKNASRRTVDLPQRAVEALRSHRKRQMEEQVGLKMAGLQARVRLEQGYSPKAVVNEIEPPLRRLPLSIGP